MATLNIVTTSLDKSDLKDLIIHQMVGFMKKNWSDDKVIDLFLDSSFNFLEPYN